MKWIRRAAAFLLTAALMISQAGLCVSAKENGTEQGGEEPELLVGELCVYTQEQGQRKVNAALYDETVILVTPQTAASLTGAQLAETGDGVYEFRRDGYAVSVNVKTGKIFIRMYLNDTESVRLYQGEGFSLLEKQMVSFGDKETVTIPLEQMLYLLNAQWSCADDCVFIYSPPETLWNVAADFEEMYQSLPSSAVILGDTAGKKWGNAFKYGLLAFADEVAPEYLIPIVGDDYWSEKKMEEALLTLALPCENIMGSLQTQAQDASGEFVSDIGGMVNDISTLGGGAVSVADKLTESVTAWSEVKIPEGISRTFSAAGFAGNMAKAIATAGRFQSWGESYVAQLRYLADVQNGDYAEYCKDLNKVAGSLASEYGNYPENVVKESLETMLSGLGGALLDMTPAGAVFSSYNLAHTFVEAYMPAAKTAQEAGDNASAAMRLNDLAVLMKAQYGDELSRTAQMGSFGSTEDLEQLRFVGSLMMGAAAHSHDSLYSAWSNMYLAGHSGAGEDEIRQNAGENITMDELAGKLVYNQTCLTRFEETQQYDPSLLLYGDMSNLYSTTAGAYREQIPPEYVKPKVDAENNGGNVVRYMGELYYWKYNSGSLESTGTFAYYPYIQTENQLICRHADGSEDVLLNANGNGPIFIVGERIYLSENGGNLYSVNLEGGDRVNHGSFEPWLADEAADTLIGVYTGSGVCLLSAADHSIRSIDQEGEHFLGAREGYCYYSSVDGEGTPVATLWRVSADGSEVTQLSQVTGAEEWSVMSMNIMQIIKAGNLLYYSYGAYGGTGGFFQGGGINCVDLDQMTTEVCVPYGELNAEEFQLIENGNETMLYYVGTDDSIGSYIGFWDDYPYTKCHVKTQKAGEEGWTAAQQVENAYLSRPGSYICVDSEIRRYNEELMSYQTLIPREAGFDFLDQPDGTEAELTLISTLDIVGEDLFFTVEQSAQSGENFGWRPVYNRERSTFYTMKIGEAQPAELYSY